VAWEYPLWPDEHERRFDRIVCKILHDTPRTEVFKLIRTGKVKVNKKKKKQDYRLQAWEVLFFFVDQPGKRQVKEIVSHQSLDTQRIIYEDEHMIAYDKPADMNVHPWDHKTTELSLIQLIHDHLWIRLWQSIFSPQLAHRIDRDTSWIVLIGKTYASLESLVKQFREHTITKTYHAYCDNAPEKRRGNIAERLLRIDEKDTRKPKVIIDPKWQSAQTHYEHTWTVSHPSFWTIEKIICTPHTGRMHQIRVHLSHIGCPIIGDQRYGSTTRHDRHLLHAAGISFTHPYSWEDAVLESALVF